MAEQQIATRKLANGLTVLVEPMSAVQSAAFTLMIPAGSSQDPTGKNGTASILSEMICRGAGDRDTRTLSSALDNLGVQRSESAGIVHMSFSGATIADKLADVLEIYGDIVLRPTLSEDEFDPSRMSVAQTLTAMEDEPRQKMLVELRRRCFDAPFGLPTDGTLEDLGNISHADIRGHFEQCFRPDAILGIAGNVEPNEIMDTVESVFGQWTAQEDSPIERVACSRKSEHIKHDSTQTHIGIAYDSVPYSSDEYYNAWAAVSLLSGGMSSRLFTEVREKRGLCYAISASMNTMKDDGRVLCYAGTTNERAQETLDVTLSELRRLSEGIETNELDRCRARAKSSLIMQQESTIGRAGSIARDFYHLGRVQTLTEVSDRVDGLTVDSVLDHVRNHPAKDFTVVTLGPNELDLTNIS
ncbi:MAG: M16 family metallopeptidase [Planctomycetaceae bacterium]